MGGKLATAYFEFLISKSLIAYENKEDFQSSRQRLPLIITNDGIEYFKFLGSNIRKFGDASCCLDGIEKKPHLSGKLGNLLFKYLADNKYITEQSGGRELNYNKNILDHLIALHK
ncbi:MAG: hypothetical protein K0Q51_1530 [Rickettsiaceae bacterium]|jgi:hypothetical protein|nr:hypothetical protein [Rickettsiaceae bacterium]